MAKEKRLRLKVEITCIPEDLKYIIPTLNNMETDEINCNITTVESYTEERN